jgi:WD40 repeat protein
MAPLFVALGLTSAFAQDIATRPERIFGYGTLWCMALASDGERIATAGSRGAFVWDRQSSQLIRGFDGYKDFFGPGETPYRQGELPHPGVGSIAFSPDGTKLLAGTQAGVVMWGVESEYQQYRIPLGESVQRVGFSPNGVKFLAAGYGRLWIWETETGRLLLAVTNDAPANPTSYLSISSDGSKVSFGATEAGIQIRRMETGEVTHDLGRPLYGVRSAAFSLDESKLLVGGYDRGQTPNSEISKAALLDVETGEVIHQLEFQSYVSFVAFLPDGSSFVTKSDAFALWDTNTGTLIRRFETGREPVLSLGEPAPVLSPDGTTVFASEGRNGRPLIVQWDVRTGNAMRSYDWHVPSYSFWEAVSSPDSQRIFLAGYSGTEFWRARIWDFETGDIVELNNGTTTSHDEFSIAIAYAATTDQLFVGYSSGFLRLWDAESGELVRTLIGHTGYVNTVAISTDGTHLLSIGDEGARLWSAADGSLLRWDMDPTDFISRFQLEERTLSPNGRWRLQVSGLGNRASLLDATTGKVVRQLQFPSAAGDFVKAAFSLGRESGADGWGRWNGLALGHPRLEHESPFRAVGSWP